MSGHATLFCAQNPFLSQLGICSTTTKNTKQLQVKLRRFHGQNFVRQEQKKLNCK